MRNAMAVWVPILLAGVMLLVGAIPSEVLGAPPTVAVPNDSDHVSGLAFPADLPFRQGIPDLTATKMNNVGGTVGTGVPFIWTITVTNIGSAPATFTTGQFLLRDEPPTVNLTDGATGTPAAFGGTTGPIVCSYNPVLAVLSCFADGSVTIPPGGGFSIAQTYTASAAGSYVNPRVLGICRADPFDVIAETMDANNNCSNTVTVQPADLTATKTNNVGGTVGTGLPWTWTITVTNSGPGVATLANSQTILLDEPPGVNVTDGATGTPALFGGTTGTILCFYNPVTDTLVCFTSGPVSIPPGGGFSIAQTYTASAAGTYLNPRGGGGRCRADPFDLIAEITNANNDCSDTVTVQGPDLTVAKADNVGGIVGIGQPWTWTITVQNNGPGVATFTNGQTLLLDEPPTTNVADGATGTPASFGGTTGTIVCFYNPVTEALSCVASGSVSIPPGGGFSIAQTYTASAAGSYLNPRGGGGVCSVDPADLIVEVTDANNDCTDSVTVSGIDLTVTKTNNVGGTTTVGTQWVWTLRVTNVGTLPLTLTNGQIILIDDLPNANISYGLINTDFLGGATGSFACAGSASLTLTCNAEAPNLTLPPNGGIEIRLPSTASAPGTYATPRAGGVCRADPNDVILEATNANNTCADTVTVRGSDLTATKTNNVGGSATIGQPFTWTIAVGNAGTAAASYANGQTILSDALPNTSITYGPVAVTPVAAITGTIACAIDGTQTLGCTASGPVSIAPNGLFQVSFPATPSATASYVNPRVAGGCLADPNNLLSEQVETNNTCSDTVSTAPRDLTAVKTNNVNGTSPLNTPWTWTVTLANVGTGIATFAAGQTVFVDALPAAGLTYGTPTATPSGGATGTLTCAVDGAANLTCTVGAGGVSIPPSGAFQVAFTAAASVSGTYANPRAGATCQVDPNNALVEVNEANNACANTVVAGAQPGAPASPVAPVSPQGAVNDPNNDDEDDRPQTETQRHQRSHTNASGQGDYHTEGNVLEVRCDTSAAPQYDVAFPTHTPYIVVATRDGNAQFRLLYGTRSQCRSIRVGQYAVADGEKQHELLFDVHSIDVR